MNARIAAGLVLLLVGSCKDKPAAAPPPAPAPTKPQPAPVAPVVVDAPIADAPLDAHVVLPAVTAEERAMVTRWFARLNGTGKLEIKGIDVEPFRARHRDQLVTETTQIAYAALPKEGKRTFLVTQPGLKVYMTFDAKDALVGISY